jgi:hypothetical protein
MPGNPLVRFDEGRVGRTVTVFALSPTLPRNPPPAGAGSGMETLAPASAL